MSDPIRHHFLPVFYLKSWSAIDGRIVEFSIPFQDKVKPRRVHPRGTGFIDKLYAVEGLSGDVSHAVEKNYLSPVDSRAATALAELYSKGDASASNRKAWADFVMSLLMRMPSEIGLLKKLINRMDVNVANRFWEVISEHVPIEFQDEARLTFVDYHKEAVSRSVGHIIDIFSHGEIVERISQMEWSVIDLSAARHELLTSDRPVVVVRNEQTSGDTVIALPIGPHKLFVATTNRSLIKELVANSPKKVAEAMNSEVINGARKLAYGRTDHQLAFVQKHLGRAKGVNFVEEILSKANADIDTLIGQLWLFMDEDLKARLNAALIDYYSRQKSLGFPQSPS
jgi:hypothetical protein